MTIKANRKKLAERTIILHAKNTWTVPEISPCGVETCQSPLRYNITAWGSQGNGKLTTSTGSADRFCGEAKDDEGEVRPVKRLTFVIRIQPVIRNELTDLERCDGSMLVTGEFNVRGEGIHFV